MIPLNPAMIKMMALALGAMVALTPLQIHADAKKPIPPKNDITQKEYESHFIDAPNPFTTPKKEYDKWWNDYKKERYPDKPSGPTQRNLIDDVRSIANIRGKTLTIWSDDGGMVNVQYKGEKPKPPFTNFYRDVNPD